MLGTPAPRNGGSAFKVRHTKIARTILSRHTVNRDSRLLLRPSRRLLIAGREFNASDRSDNPHVAIVNQVAFVEKLPSGRRT